MLDQESRSSPKSQSSSKRVLWVKGKAGLGNRLLALGTAYTYALLSGRSLYVDWSDKTYSNNGENAFNELFVSEDIAKDRPEYDRSTSVVPSLWNGKLDLSVNELIDKFYQNQHSAKNLWRRHSINLDNMKYPERIAVFWSFSSHFSELRRNLQAGNSRYRNKSEREILADIYRNRIRLHPRITKSVTDFSNANSIEDAIGVHIRYMDKKASIQDFLPYIRNIAKSNPDAPIFIATDSRDVETAIRSEFARVVTTPKWYPDNGLSMHQNSECPDRLQNAAEALGDMYLLAKCRWLVFPGRSTFSLISSIISEAPANNIFDVDRWNIRVVLKGPANFLSSAIGAKIYKHD